MLVLASEAHSAAFMLQQQGTKGSGRAFAGEAAVAEDASTIFSNPAGLTELKGPEFLVGAYVMAPNAEISNRGSTASVLAGPYNTFTGSADQGFDPQAFGHAYIAAPVNDKAWVGLGITVPFGLAVHYDPDFFGRYDTTRASVRTIDIAPTFAYQIHPRISIGGGVDLQYAEAKLANALPNPFDPSGRPTPSTDGLFTVEGSDWSLGFNAGVLFKPTENLRVGLTYRSAMSHTIEGDATTEFNGSKTVQGVSTDLNLPDTISLGAAYMLTPNLTLLGQINRYGWSRFEEIRLKLADGTQPTTVEDYRDTWGLSIGAQYRLTPALTLRGGMMYDQTPTRDVSRSTAIPDVDRLWAAVGASYSFAENIALDLSYEHLFAKDAPINRTNDFTSTLGTIVRTTGTTETSSDVIGLSLRIQF